MFHTPDSDSVIYFTNFEYYSTLYHLLTVKDFHSDGGKLLKIECIGEDTCPLCKTSKTLINSGSSSDRKLGISLHRKQERIFDAFTSVYDYLHNSNQIQYRMPSQIFRAFTVLLLDDKINKLLENSKTPLCLHFIIERNHGGFLSYDSCYFSIDKKHILPVKYLNMFENSKASISLKDAKKYYKDNILNATIS